MNLDAFKGKNPMGTLAEVADKVASAGLEKTQEILAEINLLLQLLQAAGYGVGALDFELTLSPKITIKLKPTAAMNDEKLSAILKDYPQKKLVTVVVGSLIQANRLRNSVTVETLELEGVQIVLTTSPNITLQWRDKQSGAMVVAA